MKNNVVTGENTEVPDNQTGVTGKYTKNGTPKGFTSITEYPDGNGNKIIAHGELDFGNGHLQLGAANPADCSVGV